MLGVGSAKAGAGGQEHLLAFDNEGIVERIQEPFADRLRRFDASFAHGDELIPAKSGQDVGGPHHAAKAGGGLFEDLVTGCVTGRVVDLLERVGVEEDHRL